MKKMLVADLLCGAGGSSTGCGRALADLMRACVTAIMADAAPQLAEAAE